MINMDEQAQQKDSFFHNLRLRTQLLLVFLLLFISCLTVVGAIGYFQTKNTIDTVMENRLKREVVMMSDTIQNIKYAYVNNDDLFNQQVKKISRVQIVNLMHEGIRSDAYLLTDHQLASLSSKKTIDSSLAKKISKQLGESSGDVFYVTNHSVDYTVTTKKIQELNGYYVLVTETKSYLTALEQQKKYTMMVVFVSMFIGSIVMIFFVRKVTKPLLELRQVMKAVRNGDLHRYVEVTPSSKEIKSLMISFNQMLLHMNQMIERMEKTTSCLNKTSHRLQNAYYETNDSNETLLEIIDSVDGIVQKSVQTSHKHLEKLELISNSSTQLVQHIEGMVVNHAQMNESAISGEAEVKRMSCEIASFMEKFYQVEQTINHINHFSKEITSVVEWIQMISDQTHLLALNATIEATHAGEAGKGFIVVAKEVQKLAKESKNATKKIAETVHHMLDVTTKITIEVEQMKEDLIEYKQTTKQTEVVFNTLIQTIKQMNNEMVEVEKMADQFQCVLPGVLESMERVKETSEQTLQQSVKMKWISKEQEKQFQQTNAIGKELFTISEKLMKQPTSS